ncbi:NUDIX domain-containing protein [Bacillus mangrovi]|uniref:NUDIX domain-containing protein n=1 Tax=Metabacillus mangrovi TaxID=1491830 RepID=A0A7X2S3P3_9BACI|nr:NUDIX hydrolase [Metabacillus mangrovi]MTH53059.1 NUDIX domain-containing protein [Metabacillus mangrovi]
MEPKWLTWAKEIQSLAQAGLAYSKDQFDIERFERLRNLSGEIVSEYTGEPQEKLKELFANETGYQTPKTDARAVIFKDNKILLVREMLDGKWSIPGGWADIGLTASENAVKEAYEESGLVVRAKRLIAVMDKKCHPHPPGPYHIYKLFFLCEQTGGELKTGPETLDCGYFALDELPELSSGRITESQIKILFEYCWDEDKEVYFD